MYHNEEPRGQPKTDAQRQRECRERKKRWLNNMVGKYEVLERTNAGLREELERKEKIIQAQAGEISRLRKALAKAAGGEGGGAGRGEQESEEEMKEGIEGIVVGQSTCHGGGEAAAAAAAAAVGGSNDQAQPLILPASIAPHVEGGGGGGGEVEGGEGLLQPLSLPIMVMPDTGAGEVARGEAAAGVAAAPAAGAAGELLHAYEV